MPKADNNAGRQDEIVRAAAVLFNRKGYHETSMDDIAQGVGLRKPTLYHYVDSKAQIVYLIHDGLISEFIQRIKGRLRREIPPIENLYWVMYDIFDAMETFPGHLRIYFENHRNLPEKFQRPARRKRDEYREIVEAIVADAIARGELRSADTRLVTLGLFGMCNWSYQWYRPDAPIGAGEVALGMWKQFIYGAASSAEGDGDIVSKDPLTYSDRRWNSS